MLKVHGYALSSGVFFLDQATKAWASRALTEGEPLFLFPGFALRLAYNTGAAFSFLRGVGWEGPFFTIFAILAIGYCVWLLEHHGDKRLFSFGVALVLGGALGNLADRMRLGAVVDFIDIYWGKWHWPAFNVADAAISVGVGILVLESLFPFWRKVSWR